MTNQSNVLQRPPRIQPALPSFEEVKLPMPPRSEGNRVQAVLQLGLPLLTLAAYSAVQATGQRDPRMMLPMAVSVVAAFIIGLYTFFYKLITDLRSNRAYRVRIRQQHQDMIEAHNQQYTFYWHNFPDIQTAYQIALNAGHGESRLWERRITDPDFGTIRLGVGTLPARVTYVLPEEYDAGDPRLNPAIRLEAAAATIPNMPVTIPLRPTVAPASEEDKEVAARHVLGIAGKGRIIDEFARALVLHFTTFHAPSETRLHVITTDSTRRNWLWARALPHANPPASRNAGKDQDWLRTGSEEARGLLDAIRAELGSRKRLLEEGGDASIPFNLLIIDASGIDGAALLSEIQKLPTLSTIYEQGQTLGYAVIFMVADFLLLPSDCIGVIRLDAANGAPHFTYSETGINGWNWEGTADLGERQRAHDEFTPTLARYEMGESFNSLLPTAVNVLDMLNIERFDQLNMAEKWRYSRARENASWLSVPIGIRQGGEVRELLFSADGDGNHGMIAGTTGAGKSELLLTLVTMMAVRYDPSVLNFVLVDYKSGSAFAPVKNLPHVVDIITNLHGSRAMRAFTAFKAEIDRRGKLMAETLCSDIVEYRRRGLHETHLPLPFLFIIVDEFAELIKENPEFRARLENITRLGRSLGVHLLLATQQPAGVISEQMRANIKFVLCLRMRNKDESRELIGRSDAALLPSNISGRGYLAIGYDELELIQVAHTGGVYTDPDKVNKDPIKWHETRQDPIYEEPNYDTQNA